MIFRFDDISVNTDMKHAQELLIRIWERFPKARVIYCISPLVFDMTHSVDSITRQRIFPRMLNAMSDPRVYYDVDIAGLPHVPEAIECASHGLIHVDHRLLDYGAQELSIKVSCALVKTRMFCPPFNKYNSDTIKICDDLDIKLFRFEDGWRCVEYEPYDSDFGRWYLHSREITVECMERWLEGARG